MRPVRQYPDAPATEPAQVESATDVDRSDLSAVQETCPSETVVWVNTKSGVYHLPGERWYGATESGEYWCQSKADGQGYRETRNGQ